MTPPLPSPDPPDGWITALHEAILTDTQADAKAHERLNISNDFVLRVHSCLSLLEDLRRENLASHGVVREWLEQQNNKGGAETPEATRIGRFEIIEELGRGGHGIVLLAYDPTLKRQVALKVPRPELLTSAHLRERFMREAKAAARLTHPAIVQVHELGNAGPICYIAAEFCAGQTLADCIREEGPCRDVAAAAKLVKVLADAVGYANSQGVLHRDLKPANVMLVPSTGTEVKCPPEGIHIDLTFQPKLTDFGLAKLVDMETDHTRSGTMIGTPSYMAPEQAEGRLASIGPTTDVYGLGVILYELLTGRPPFRGANDADTLRQVSIGEPTAPGRLRPGLPRDLEAICLKCLEHSGSRRYASAGELADDLTKFLAGESTQARPINFMSKGGRWATRRPLVAALLGLSATLMIAMMIGTLIYNRQLAKHAADAHLQRLHSEASESQARHLLYAADLRAAQIAWNDGRPKNAEHILKTYLPTAGQDDLREFSWHYLWGLVHQNQSTLRGHIGDVYDAAMSVQQPLIATCGKDGTVRLWNSTTSEEVAKFTDHIGEVNHVAFAPNGKWLVSVGDDGTIRIRDVATHHTIQILSNEGSAVLAAAFSPDNSQLATGGKDREIRLWDTTTWSSQGTLQGHKDFVECLAYSPDGALLASGGDDLRVWEVRSGVLFKHFSDFGSTISSVTFSRDGKSIAAGSKDHTARLWQLDRDAPSIAFTGHKAAVHDVSLANGHEWLATASKDGTVIVWDIRSRQQRRIYQGHPERVWSVAFIENDTSLLTSGADGTAKICKLGDPYRELRTTANGFSDQFYWWAVGFSTDGRLAFGGRSNTESWCVLNDLPSFQNVKTVNFEGGCADVGFLNSGGTLAIWGMHPQLQAIDLKTGKSLSQVFPPHYGAGFACEPNGPHVLVGGNFPLLIWDANQNCRAGELPGDPALEVYRMAFDHSGQRVAIVVSDNAIQVWDFKKRQLLERFEAPISALSNVAFTPDGDVLSSGSDAMVRRWTPGNASPTAVFDTGMNNLFSMALHPQGRTLAVGSVDTLKLFDLNTNSPLLTMPSEGVVCRLAFSPDGRFLVSGHNNAKLLLWDAAPTSSGPPSGQGITQDVTSWQVPTRSQMADSAMDRMLPVGTPEQLADLPSRFRLVSNWATNNGFKAGFPTYIDHETDEGLAIGALGIRRLAMDKENAFNDVLEKFESVDSSLDYPRMHQHRIFRWGADRGVKAAIPNFHQGLLQGRIFSSWSGLLEKDIDVRWVPAAKLGDISSYESRLRAIQSYAQEQGFVGGFPNFVDQAEESKTGVGVVLIRNTAGVVLSIQARELRE